MLGPSLLAIVETGGGALPSWLTAEDSVYLSGGVKDPDVRGALSVEGFATGELQQAIEDEVRNYVPMKATALLVNAGLQRDAIAASNLLFGWPVYPSYYGSSLVDAPDDGRLLEMAEKATDDKVASCKSIAEAYEAFAARHPDLKTYLYFAPDSLNAAGNPTSGLISNALTYDDMRQVFTGEDLSYTWIDGGVTYEDFKDAWYKTDHHWMTKGAYEAYLRIADALGLGDIIEPLDEKTCDAPEFYGSLSRRSLDDSYKDKIDDLECDFPEFSISINGEQRSLEDVVHANAYESGEWIRNRFANRYAEYFHTDFGLIQFDNPTPTVDKSLLIVGDSYTNCMERFLASNYATTYVFDCRYDERTLDEFLVSHPDVDDVVFVMRSTNFLSDTTRKALG